MAAMSSNNTQKETSLIKIFNILYRRKIIIISSAFVCLILAILYNQFSTPIYESEALIKKEYPERRGDNLYELVRLQTKDELSTEIELIQTEEVLGRVINKLKLLVELKEIIDPIGNSFELNNVFIDFPDSGNTYSEQIGFSLPIFTNVELKKINEGMELCIVKKGENLFELWDVEKNKLILSSKTSPVNEIDTLNGFYSTTTLDSILTLDKHPRGAIFNTGFAQFKFSWNDAPVGSKIYFNFNNYTQFLKKFRNTINIWRKGPTNMFTLNVRLPTPLACKLIANEIIDSFRESRAEQQKQLLSYSFQFVDEQLTDIQKKLHDAEDNLSNFKASGEIMTIDSHTAELMGYLSTLEAEKLKTDMELADYQNKAEAMRQELKSSGYFDQAFFDSPGEIGGSSPFSTLMTQLSDLEVQRLKLLEKNTEKHPDVIKLDEQIRLTKDKLADYNQNTLTSYGIIIDNLQKKLQKISTLMSSYGAEMKRLPEKENKMERLIREKDVYKKIFKLLLDKREEMRVTELSILQDIIVIDPPSEPIKPIRPRKVLNMLGALIFGGFIGIVLIFLIELKNTRLINLDDLEMELGIPILALIPKYDKSILKRINNPADDKDMFVTMQKDNLGIRESYRLLTTKLFQLDLRDKTILVTSCEEETGKTQIVANLAVTMALNNKNILVIDCDLRKAELSNLFHVFQNSPGLVDFIEKGDSPEVYTKVLKKINIIPAGGLRENSSILLSSDRMKSLFEIIDISVYDFIIIDTPPITRVVDTLALGHIVKNSILVVRPDVSFKETVVGGIQELNHARIKIRGIVANAAEIQKSYYYRYRYGYGYGYGKSNGENGRFRSRINIEKRDRNQLHKLSKISHS